MPDPPPDPLPEDHPFEMARRIRRESDALRHRAAVLRAESEQTRCDVEVLRSTARLERGRAAQAS